MDINFGEMIGKLINVSNVLSLKSYLNKYNMINIIIKSCIININSLKRPENCSEYVPQLAINVISIR